MIAFIQKYKWILIILIIALAVRVYYLAMPAGVWWDASTYMGMGKWLYSGGTQGLWEPFRPVLWPMILGLFWKMGVSMIAVGKALTVLASLGTVVLAYMIGERIRRNAGLFAATLLAFTPLYLSFANVQMTDIPSAFFALLAVWLVLREKYFWSGLAVGVAFMMRFPQGLVLLPLGLSVLIYTWGSWKLLFLRGLMLGLGFAVLAVPYLVSNYYLYGDPLLPITWGSKMITGFMWLYGHDWTFYFRTLFYNNPFVIFALAGILIASLRWRSLYANRALWTILLVAAALVAYFTHLPHKELRYALIFLPYVVLLAGYGMSRVIPPSWVKWLACLCIPLVLTIYSYQHFEFLKYPQGESPAYMQFYTYYNTLEKAPTVITATPIPAAHARAKFIEAFNTWGYVESIYEDNKNIADYVALDSCQMVCDPTDPAVCTAERTALFAKLDAKESKVFEAKSGRCELQIYKLTGKR